MWAAGVPFRQRPFSYKSMSIDQSALQRDITAQINDWPVQMRHYYDPNNAASFHQAAVGLNTSDDISQLLDGGLLDNATADVIARAIDFSPLPKPRDRVDIQIGGYGVNQPAAAKQLMSGNSAATQSNFVTASVAPDPNQLILLAVSNRGSNSPADLVASVSGNGLTWIQLATLTTGGDTFTRLTLFRAIGASPTPGPITIDFAGLNQTRTTWSVSEFANVDLAGTIPQLVTNATVNSATSFAVNLGQFQDILDAFYGVFVVNNSQILVPGTGFTLLDTEQTVGSNSLLTEWGNTSIQAVSASGVLSKWAAIALEIKAITSAVWFKYEIKHAPDHYDPLGPEFNIKIGTPNA